MNKMTVGVGILMAMLSAPALACVVGCGPVIDNYRSGVRGFLGGLVEAETGGVPANAMAWRAGEDTVVSVWSEGQSRGQRIILRRESLDGLSVGLHRVTAEGTLEDDAIDFEIQGCASPSVEEPECVHAEAQEIDVVDLGNGTRRATYRAELVRSDGTAESIEGSFVVEPPVLDQTP